MKQSGNTKYKCPKCGYLQDEVLVYALEECIVCENKIDTRLYLINKVSERQRQIFKQLRELKKWLKSQDAPDKDELLKRLNAILKQSQ